MRTVKILILLSFLASIKVPSAPTTGAGPPEGDLRAPHGPVFNPLRAKPYTKIRANA